MASRLNPYLSFEGGGFGGTVCISGEGEADRLRAYWNALKEGAQVTVPLERQPWGDEFGQLVDRFGVTWMVDIGDAQGGDARSSEAQSSEAQSSDAG